MVQETAVTKRGPVDISEVAAALGGQALAVSPQYVESTVRSLALLRQLVHEVLVEGRDYGSVPGLPEFLWDPGASTIIASFNCHAGHRRVLSHIDDGKRLSMVLEVPIIHNITQLEVGSGIGATTVAETKYKYRWEKNPEGWGYSEEQIEKLETRERYDHTEYKILNPEPADLLNTVVKMASKRAEVDAAEGLPGAASALRELLDPKLKRGYKPSNANPPKGGMDEGSPRWTAFWTQAKALLETKAEVQGVEVSTLVHQMLGVKSMNDWPKAGKSLDDAIRALSEKLAQEGDKSSQKSPSVASKVKPRADWEKITQEAVSTFPKLETAFHNLTDKQPKEMYAELGVSSRNDMTITAWEAFKNLMETFAPKGR